MGTLPLQALLVAVALEVLHFIEELLTRFHIASPVLLALRVGGHFPGLWTPPLVGVAGVLPTVRLVRMGRIPEPPLRAS